LFVVGWVEVADKLTREKFVSVEDLFADQTIFGEGLTEHSGGVISEVPCRIRTAVAESCGRTDADQLSRRRFDPSLDAPD